jgi:hypothetical protein
MLVYLLLAATLFSRPGPGPARSGFSASRASRGRATITLAARIGPPPLTRGLRRAQVSVQRLAIDAAASRAPEIAR